jgi:hypothetical protein
VQLLDGRVLSATPWNWPDQLVLPTEIWDPDTGEWSVSGAQQVPSTQTPAVALPDGRVLVAGGIVWDSFRDGTDHPLARAEVWDPATGRWTLAADMSTPRTGHAMAVVGGRALVIGGFAVYPDGDGLDTCEIFDAESGTWSPGPRLNVPGSAALATLQDGRLLRAGGTARSGGNQAEGAAAEVYDPDSERWQLVDPMLEARGGHVLTVLADGRVLATGGAQGSFATSTTTAEIFDPATGSWSRAASMRDTRRFHGAALLPSGEVLVVGGYPGGQYTSEIYTPCE